MRSAWSTITAGYLRLVEPVAATLARRGVSPNLLSTVGLACTLVAAAAFAAGAVRAAGWILGVTAVFDVLDGRVARLGGSATPFGAFYDSTLDRIADAAVFAGLTVFFARADATRSVAMVGVTVVAAAGAFVTSYTNARAEALGVHARVGLLQRPERVVLLSAPAAFFGADWNGAALRAVVVTLAVAGWITVAQRIASVRAALAEAR